MANQKQEINTPKRPSFLRRAFSWVWRKKWWFLLFIVVLIAIWLIFGGEERSVKSGYSLLKLPVAICARLLVRLVKFNR